MNPFNPFSPFQPSEFNRESRSPQESLEALTQMSNGIGTSSVTTDMVTAQQRGNIQFQSLLKTATSQFNAVQAQEWWVLTSEATCPKVVLEVLRSYYQELLTKQPDHTEAMVRAAWCQWRLGELLAVEGITQCQKAIGLNPQQGESWLYLAQFQRHCGLTEKAMTSIQKAMLYLSLVGKIEARKQLIAWQRVAFEQQVISLWQWMALQMEQRLCHVVDYWLLMAEGRWHQLQKKRLDAGMLKTLSTIEIMAQPATTGNTNVTSSPTVGGTEPTTVDVIENLTQVLSNGMQQTTDMTHYTNNTELTVNTGSSSKALVPVVSKSQWSMLLNKSVHGKVIRLLEQEEWEPAIAQLEDWLILHTEDTDVYYALVQACYTSQRLVKGLYYCRVLLNKLPHHAKAYHTMAILAHALDDIDGAIEAYKTAITFGLDPAWTAGVARELATVFMKEKQDADHAIACLKLSQELHPTELEAQFQLAELYCDLGEYLQAITLYESLAELQPSNADIFGFLGFLYWQVDRFSEAEVAYLTTIELEPTNAIALNNLGVLYLDVHGDSTRALQQFEAATSINPNYTMAWFNQGRVFQQQGQVMRAKNSYRKAKALNQGDFYELDVMELEMRLQQLGE
jgi:tetratricopeptide (TPR) repeat protein